jgi:hypothetical protein
MLTLIATIWYKTLLGFGKELYTGCSIFSTLEKRLLDRV